MKLETFITEIHPADGVLQAIMSNKEVSAVEPGGGADIPPARVLNSESGTPAAVVILQDIVTNKDGQLSAEIRANACSLVVALMRVSVNSTVSEQRAIFKHLLKKVLEETTSNIEASHQVEGILTESINKALGVL
jgi:hypothetical protein